MLSDKQRQLVLELKEELKALAAKIKADKPEFKQAQRDYTKAVNPPKELAKQLRDNIWKTMSVLYTDKYNFRHKHVARCLLRGRTMEQIEAEGSVGLEYNIVEQLMKEFKEKFDAAA